jgi:acyl-CoA dehydrogenase
MSVLDERSLFNDDHRAFRDSVRRFLVDQAVPQLSSWRAMTSSPAELIAEAGRQGMLGAAAPEELGGGGADLCFTTVLVEEAAAVGATGLAVTLAMHSGVCLPTVVEHGSRQQRERWVPALIDGTVLATVAGGLVALETKGGATGPTLSGRLENVVAGAVAGLLVTPVVAGGDRATSLLDLSACVRAPVTDALGARDGMPADLDLDAAAADLLPGGEITGENMRRDVDLWLAVVAMAASRAALKTTVAYVRDRRVFGRRLADLENTRCRLSETAARIVAAQHLVDDCLSARVADRLGRSQAGALRLIAGGAHDEAVDRGLQLHGGYGYIREFPIAQAFADARALREYELAAGDPREGIAAAIGL